MPPLPQQPETLGSASAHSTRQKSAIYKAGHARPDRDERLANLEQRGPQSGDAIKIKTLPL